MDPIRLIHIAPELPPKVGGVADYTAILSRRLVEVSDGAVEPVLVHAGKERAAAIDVEFPAVDLSGGCTTEALEEAISRIDLETDHRSVVLLEYSNYGYSRYGVPFRLAQGLKRACRHKGIPLMTMFHELYATGLPWKSIFWRSFPQRLVADQLVRQSDRVFTNRTRAVAWLTRYRRSWEDTVHVQPVFSNVGEPAELPPFERRSPNVVVFGGKKDRMYQDKGRIPRRLVEQHGIENVFDIGPAKEFDRLESGHLEFCGVLSSKAISNKLSDALLGLIAYPATRLSKSGAAAAFASHGLPFVLVDEDEGGAADYYKEGKHFWRWSTLSNSPQLLGKQRLADMSRAIRTLYDDHMHSRLAAKRFTTVFRRSTSQALIPQSRKS
jgi:hypothetical protein